MNRKRYFQDTNGKEKYPVGKLSSELRKALHLEDDMLPFWIYRMRVLGYPPAWMKQAEMSTLSIIDIPSSSRKRDRNSSSQEEGEIKDTTQYNKDSLIEFPGFNAPIPTNVKDDWLILGMPPLIMKQQLSEAVKTMKLIEPVPYKKAKLDLSTTKDDSAPASPSSPEPNATDDSQDVVLIESTNGDKSSDTLLNSSKISDVNNESISTERKLKVISMGTPVPDSIKPRLPSLDKWAVGMGELMYFENLPTSTGAYKQKMKGIIGKIRDRLAED